MKSFPFLFFILFLFPSLAFSESWYVIQLKSGVTIRTTGMKNIDADTLELTLRNGHTVQYPTSEIIGIDVEDGTTLQSDAPRHRGVAFALSFIPPLVSPLHGLGQLYNGDVKAGLFFFTAGLVGSALLYKGFQAHPDNNDQVRIGAVILVGSWLLSSKDAYDYAR